MVFLLCVIMGTALTTYPLFEHISPTFKKPKTTTGWCLLTGVGIYFAYYSVIKFKRPIPADKLKKLNSWFDYIIYAQLERDDIDPATDLPKYPAHGLGHILSPLDKAGRVTISFVKMLYFIRELYNDICLFSELL